MTTENAGFTLWLTGMRGAGKSTLAGYLAQRLRAVGRPVEVLDASDLEKVKLATGLDAALTGAGLAKEQWNDEVRRIGFLAKLLSRNGAVAIVAHLSPFRESREALRREINRFVEVFVDCPVETLIRRDQKGHYKKALAGELTNFTGVTAPYEPPVHPELVVKTSEESVDQSGQKIVQALLDLGCLRPVEVTAIIGQRARRRPAEKPRAGRPARAARRSAGKGKRPVVRKAVRSVKGAAHRRARR